MISPSCWGIEPTLEPKTTGSHDSPFFNAHNTRTLVVQVFSRDDGKRGL